MRVPRINHGGTTIMTSPTITPAPAMPASKPGIPPLRNGDHLTRHEFERRYEAMPEIKKAELIEGVVFMPSPVSFEDHGEPHAHLVGWLAWYRTFTPGARVADNSTVLLDLDNEP